jgi:hypothetical protein
MDLFKRISASVILAAPFFFAVDGFAAAKTAKAESSSSSINYSGKLGFAYLNLSGNDHFDVTDTFRPELTVYGSPTGSFLGQDVQQVWFMGVKVSGQPGNSGVYDWQSLASSSIQSAGRALTLSKLGVKTSGKYGSLDIGSFGTKSMLVLGNNFSMVSDTPTNISADFKYYAPTKRGDQAVNTHLFVGNMIGDWSGQGSAFHIGYTTPSYMNTTLSLSYAPMDSSSSYGEFKVHNDSSSLTLAHHGEVMGVKYDARASYTNKTRQVGTSSAATITYPGTSVAKQPADLNFHTDQSSLSLALEKSGMTFSAGYSDHKWHNVTEAYYNGVRANNKYFGTTTIATTRLLNPKFFDFSIGYQKPMLGGYGAVKLGHTISSNWGTGLSTSVMNSNYINPNAVRSATDTIQKNRTHVSSVGFAHHVKNLSTGVFYNHYRNHVLFQSAAGAHNDIFNALEIGTNYAF